MCDQDFKDIAKYKNHSPVRSIEVLSIQTAMTVEYCGGVGAGDHHKDLVRTTYL